MKKITTIAVCFVSLLSLISCKEEKKKEIIKNNEVAKTNDRANDCEFILHISKDRFNNANDLRTWITNNTNFLCNYNNENDSIKVGVKKFNDNVKLADWLKANATFIDYGSSSKNIEKMHKKAISSSEEANLTFSQDVYSWMQLKSKINIISNDNFKKYVNFDIDTNDKLVFTEVKNHYDNSGKNNFSIPLFKAIAKNNNLVDDDKFHFAKDSQDEIVFKIVQKNGTILKFYDISSIPVKKDFDEL